MDHDECATLARRWQAALSAVSDAPAYSDISTVLLSDLLSTLHAGLNAEHFDASVGFGIGAALACARLTDRLVPAVSARVLHNLTRHSDRADATSRLGALFAAIGQGHHAAAEATGPADAEWHQRFRLVFDHASIAIALGDTNGVLLEANPHLAAMIGVPATELRGISVYDFAHPGDSCDIKKLVYEKLVPNQQGTVRIERRLLRADGSVGWATFAITYVKGAGGQPDYLLAIGEDVTERHKLQEQLRYQARHDQLTDLPNRRHLLQQLMAVINESTDNDQVGLCFIDLDHFKQVNDKFGHGTGDQVLAAVARRLRDSLQDEGCLIARIGGDEFVVMIRPPADSERVSAVASSLRGAFLHPVTIGEHCLDISASIGAVVTSVVGADPEWLLDAADTMLWRAKLESKGGWILHAVHGPTTTESAGRRRLPRFRTL
ncbi:diguanylate cyclase domain-containing protein [Nocardia africana]|uniref:Diguanylate cyclase domain-containing protein n=1 Tax=Nocardia africana TaxID=134964 RepID=A0ABW6NWD2_9NOCA